MRGAAAALPLLVLLASAAAPVAEPKAPLKTSRTKSSANGVYAIRLEQVDEKTCRIVALKDRDVAWKLDRCFGGTVDDLLFINNEGSRFWLLSVLPELPEGAERPRGDKAKTDPMFEAVVAAEYDKDGRLLASRKLKDFLEYKRRGLLRKLEKHFKWLQGMVDVPGKAPRVSDAELVEFEPVSGKTQQLKF
jgi:hypothetical protein